MEIEINGIKYSKNEKPIQKTSKGISTLLSMALMIGAGLEFAARGNLGTSKVRQSQMSEQNLIEEYGLIQQKKSKLSSKQREWVVYKFGLQYKRLA